ncbi:MAG TPA: hypothetical protein DF712_19365 [Balneola sp.]|nr:hypothetical protein [Bacteroidota bacterium]HCI69667.1 hypothetical protein [Balneola sp.]HCT54608.1 hypothetical protein [Balneola sp.]|tara:strand:- start:4593 stop:6653 length:2061 start_codon:yes stop_codon:yes gene_type:complete
MKPDNYKFGNIIENLLHQEIFRHELVNIPNKLEEAKKGDFVFIQLGGDSTKKRRYFEDINEQLKDFVNGIYGIGIILSTNPKDKKVEIEFYGFKKPVTKKQLYFYPQFIDSLGASTKGIPNQAGLYGINNYEAKSFIDFLKQEGLLGVSGTILNNIDTDGYLISNAKSILSKDKELASTTTKKLINEINNEGLKEPFEIPKSFEDFSVEQFYQALETAGLVYSKNIVRRFISSILSKPFTILTGLSGSGKTKLVQAFCTWITRKQIPLTYGEIFKKGTTVLSDRVEYLVENSDKYSVIFKQPDTGTKISLSFEIIEEWVQTIDKSKFDESVPARVIREELKQKTSYSSQEHSYETHLKAAAFYLLKNQNKCNVKRQYEIIPVGADWTNREPLLGYPNALEQEDYVLPESGVLQLILRAIKDPLRPYFLILDEMNLSHVERYFADFLSAIESKEEITLHSGDEGALWNGVPPSIKIPANLFIIGTVNIDETTYMFSPKVLDRANVIEFRVSQDELATFLENPADVDLCKIEGKGAGMAEDFVRIANSDASTYSQKDVLSEELLKFFSELNSVGAEFGYRSAFEINRFASLAEQLAENWEFDQIMDAAIVQKLLPKLHGSRRKLEKVLFKLGDLCHPTADISCEELFKKHEHLTSEIIEKAKYPISFEKIVRMHKGLVENGFTSFAEA